MKKVHGLQLFKSCVGTGLLTVLLLLGEAYFFAHLTIAAALREFL